MKKPIKKPNPMWVDAPYECIIGFNPKFAEEIRKETEMLLGKKLKCEYLKNGMYRIYEG